MKMQNMNLIDWWHVVDVKYSGHVGLLSKWKISTADLLFAGVHVAFVTIQYSLQ